MCTVIGEALLDMVQGDTDGVFVARPGGGPMNTAIGLQRLGHPTQLMARLSTTGLGRVVRAHIAANLVGLDAAVETRQQATLAFAGLDEQGRASYDFYVNDTADWGWTADELDRLPESTQVLHTGSLTAALPPGVDAVRRLVGRVRGDGEVLTSYDPNVRAALLGEHTSAVATVESFVAAAHVVKASEEDFEWLYPEIRPAEALRAWIQRGPSLAVMTRGPDGCVAATAGGDVVEMPGRQVHVVDTIGAGDAFASGLLSGLIDGGWASPSAIGSVTAEGLHAVLDRAVKVAALTCERAGADPPGRAEVDRWAGPR